MRVTKAEVIKTASDMADRNGLHNVSLKAIAENLGIRTPSLYNHIGSLDELLREIAHSGMRTMNEKMIRAAIGKTGDSALKLVAVGMEQRKQQSFLMIIYLYLKHLFAHVALIQIRPLKF